MHSQKIPPSKVWKFAQNIFMTNHTRNPRNALGGILVDSMAYWAITCRIPILTYALFFCIVYGRRIQGVIITKISTRKFSKWGKMCWRIVWGAITWHIVMLTIQSTFYGNKTMLPKFGKGHEQIALLYFVAQSQHTTNNNTSCSRCGQTGGLIPHNGQFYKGKLLCRQCIEICEG